MGWYRMRIFLLALLMGTAFSTSIPDFTLGADSAGPVVIDRLAASVNSALILQSDIARFRRTVKLRAQLDPLFSGTTVASKGTQATDKEITDFLIDERLISQAFPVSDAETEQEINSIQANNKIDRQTLKQALSDQGFKFEEYFELIRASASKRNLIDRDIRTKVTVSEDDIRNYFYNTQTRGSSVPVSYHLELISISIANYKTLAAARDVAQRALSALKSGESFPEVARRMSNHASAAAGGDLGTLTEDNMSAQFREQAKKLKIGGISEIFGGSESGTFNILKLVNVKSSDSDRFEKMKNEIRAQLTATEYQHQISLWLDRHRQLAFIHYGGQAPSTSMPAPTSKP